MIFSNNNIKAVDPNTFQSGVGNLRKIDLSRNFIQTLDVNLFVNAIMLTEINLSGNAIVIFTPKLHNLIRLEFMYLTGNQMEQLNCNIFPDSVTNETKIYVDWNHLTEVNMNCINYNGNSRITLNIGGNHIEELTFVTSKLSNNMGALYASDNEIENISIESDMKQLKHLTLANNSETDISNVTQHCISLGIIGLSDNDIDTLSADLFKKMTYLNEIRLTR